MLNDRQLQECIDDIRDGSEEAVKKLVNEYYTFYLDAAYAARLSQEDAKHFANHATRSLFSNIRSISDAKSWQALADQELEELPRFITEAAEPQPVQPAASRKTGVFDEAKEELPREEKPKSTKEQLAHLCDDEEEATEESQPAPRRQTHKAPVYDSTEEIEEIPQPSRKQMSRKERLAHLFDDEEEEEEEEIRKPARRQKKRPAPVYDDEDATEEIERPKKKKKKGGLMSAIFVTDDDEDEEEETEEIVRPAKRQETKKPVREYEEDDYDDDEDDDESGFHLPVWLLALLAVVLLIGFTVLAVKIFLPDTWENITGKLGGKDSPAATATPTPEATPSETPAYTAAPEESVEPGTAETPEASAAPEPETPANGVVGTGSVKVNGLNIRSKPSTSGERVGSAVNGKSYDVYEVASGEGYTWYRIADNQWIADKGGEWVNYTAN